MVTKNDTAKGPVAGEKSPEGSAVIAPYEPQWGEVTTWAQAVDELANVIFVAAEEFGNGAEKVEKEALLGIRFLILEFKFQTDPKTKRDYVNVLLMAENGKKAWFNDGSTGVFAQLQHFYAKRKLTGGIRCDQGLRVSEYEHTDERTGEISMAKTFYLA